MDSLRGRTRSLRLFRLAACGSLLTAAAFAAACGMDQGEPTVVDKPRVLAMKAEPPEIEAGGKSELTALVAFPYDFDPGPEPPVLVWGLCELSGKVTGQSCADPESAKMLGAGGPEDRIPLEDPGTGAAPPVIAGPGSPSSISYVIGLFSKAGKEELKAFKRFVVSASDNPNRNPVITDVLIDGAPLTEFGPIEPGKEYTLEVQTPDDAAQTYVNLSAGGGSEKTEDLFLAWFATAEGFEKDRSFKVPFENKWRAPEKAPESGKVRFWIVLHDSREGVDWKSFELAY